MPGTPPANVDPRCNVPIATEDYHQPLPEANIISEASAAPDTSLPEAKMIVDAEAVPFIEPIDQPEETPVQDIYQTAPAVAPIAGDLFAELDSMPEETAASPLKPLQRPRPVAAEPSESTGSPNILGYFSSRPLACLLLLTTIVFLVWAHTTTGPVAILAISSAWINAPFNFFLIYLGFRHDRGKSWDDTLIKIWLGLVIFGFVCTIGVMGLMVIGAMMSAKGGAGPAIVMLAVILVALAMQAGMVYVWYLLLQRFGFFRPNAFVAVVGTVLSLAILPNLPLPDQGKSHNVAQRDSVTFSNTPNQGVPTPGHAPPFNADSFNVGDSPEAQAAKQMIEQDIAKLHNSAANGHDGMPPATNENPVDTLDNTSTNENPFETAKSEETPANPFEPVDESPVNENPLESSEAKPADENPFATTSDNPFALPGDPPASENPFETSTDNPFEASSNEASKPNDSPKGEEDSNLSGVGNVSVELILDRLNNGTTSGVKRLLKSLSRHKPVDEKREAVCRSMISLLENDRLTFAHREIIDILTAWMTPKVSDDLVKVMKASNDYNSNEMIKQLAEIPDDKVAAAIVELWAKKPHYLQEAVVTLGPRAEEPLWTVLESSDPQLKVEACKLLAEQGTQKSIIKLAKLAYTKGEARAVAEAAENAMKALNAKEEKQ